MKASIQIGLALALLASLSLACSLTAPAAPAPAAVPTFVPPAVTVEAPPAEPPLPTAAPSEPAAGPNAYYEGVSFTYDPGLARGVTAQTVESTGPAGDDLPFFAVHPKQTEFAFQGYVSASQVEPRVLVFDIAEYEQLAAEYGDANPVTEEVTKLKQLLKDRPADSSGRLPFLMPAWNATEVMHARLKYLDFQNGSGIRFLAEYGQGPAVVSNDLLFYAFQGISADGRWYVSAVLPVHHAPLPGAAENEALIQNDFQKFIENFRAYVVEAQNQLNAEADASFTPDLAVLDALAGSIRIDR